MSSKLKLTLFSAYKKILTSRYGRTLRYAPGANFLFGLLWPYENTIEVQGSKMYVNVYDKDPIMRRTFRAYALEGVHEESTTILFKKVVKEGDVVVDLGANIGYFSLLAAKLVGKKGKVYSFEPEPRNYNYLLKNIELNGYDNVFATQKAVGEEAGKVKLYICPYDTGHHTINQYGGIKEYESVYKYDSTEDKKEFVEVEKVSLDDFFKDRTQQIDVIKMDVEGAEMLALSGMNRIIKENKNLKMFVEFFPLLIREMGSSPEEFIHKLLEDYRFSMFVIPDDYSASKKIIRIDSVDEIMDLCKGETDHVNLFLEKR